MKTILSLWTLVLLFALTAASSFAQVETKWISQAVVPGEKTILLVIMTNGSMVEPMPLPKIEGASVRYSGSNYLPWENSPNRTAYYIAFEVTADKPGIVIIPPITLQADNGATYRTLEQHLTVYPFDAIKWAYIPNTNDRYQYGTLWHIADKSPYVNQPDPCELKFYTPELITDYQLPSIKTNGVAAWQFEPALLERSIRPLGTALLRGRNWKVMTFHSTLTPLRGGDVSVSGEVNSFAVAENADPMLAQFVRNLVTVPLPIPALQINSQELPAGAPDSYDNAVGQFTINTKTQALDMSANEPISVQITVEGTGNIDSLTCPNPFNSEQWKLYPANKLSKDAPRTLSGKVVFQRLMRPTAETDAIPAFELTYFDPILKTYKTVTSAPIPLPWKASAPGMIPAGSTMQAEPPPAGIVPIEKMTDIYGMIPEEIKGIIHPSTSPWWYLLAYIPALFILGFGIKGYLKKKREMSTESRMRLNAFKSISTKTSSNAFLRSLGSFIESYIPEENRDETTMNILRTRDAQAFLPESPGTELVSSHKSAMMKHIRHILSKLPILLIASIILYPNSALSVDAPENKPTTPRTAESTYERGEYSLASKEFEQIAKQDQLSPQARAAAYFGLGNSLYRLNKPGEAALNYRRALNLTPNFKEAEKNLAFIERKEGAVMPSFDPSQEWLTFVPYGTIVPVIILAGAVFVTAILCLIVYTKRTVLISLIAALSFLVLIAGIVNKAMYPATPRSIDQNLLLIATQATPARGSADLAAPALITLPPSTPMIEIARRGSWYYVRTFNGTPIWVHRSTVAPVLQQSR